MVLSTEMRVLVDRNWEGGVWRCCSEVDVRRVGAWDLLPAVAHPYLRGPSSNGAKAQSCKCRTAFFERYRPTQEQALAGPIPHKKSATFWVALLLVRDSVGIRTQDPQLRRLLLYPAELPNQSLFRFESGCKDRENFHFAKINLHKV